MNPEIRFRVPAHVHQLALQKANELGLKTRKGKTGGASEMARGALYVFLGLGLPSGIEENGDYERVRANRPSPSGDPELLVTVHHRVNDDFRKARALSGAEPIPSRSTTEFRFPQGQLPHFLVPYVVLKECGTLYSTLNLEGSLSPRPHSLGSLYSAHETATLEELESCLQGLEQKRREQQREREKREEKLHRGTEFLKTWSTQKGSSLLQARLSGNFEWLTLACEEYARSYLQKLGLRELTRMATTTTLEGGHNRYQGLQTQREPKLQTIQTLQRLQELEEPGLSFHAIAVDDTQSGPLEGVQVSLELPVPGRIHFLTALISR